MIDVIHKVIAPVQSRIHQLFRFGSLSRVNSSRAYNSLQIAFTKDDAREVPHYQPFGMHAVPPLGSRVLVVSPSGIPSGAIGICASKPETARKYDEIKNMQPGGSAIYNAFDSSVTLNEKEILIRSGRTQITIIKSGEVKIKCAGVDLVTLSEKAVSIRNGDAHFSLKNSGAVQIQSKGSDLIEELASTIDKIQKASLTGTTPTGPVKFATAFPSGSSIRNLGE